MKPIAIDLRKRVVAARYVDGQSMGQIAERFKMPKGTVQNIIERYRDTGSVEPKPPNSGRKSAFTAQDLVLLEQDVQKYPDATLEELRERSSVKVSIVSFHNALKKIGYTRKKNRYVRENNYVQM